MKSLLLAVAALLFIPVQSTLADTPAQSIQSSVIRALSKRDKELARAFKNKISGIRVTCSGKVIVRLPDDTADIRHQRFIIQLGSGQTLLITHNIDLAKRVKNLRLGDNVTLRGEYIWNNKGGLIHYTHRDPAGIQPSGWIQHRGVTYK